MRAALATLLVTVLLLGAGSPAGGDGSAPPPVDRPVSSERPVDPVDEAPLDDDCDETQPGGQPEGPAVADVAAGPDLRDSVKHPHQRHRLTAGLIEQAMTVAREIDPALAARLQRLRDRDPVAFQQSMATTGRRLIGMAELKSRDPKLYGYKLSELRTEAQVNRTARELRLARATGSAEAAALEEELRRNVRVQVALSFAARAEYLRRLREHLAALEERIRGDVVNFDQTVERRMRDALAEPDLKATRLGESD